MEGRPIDTLGYRGMHSYEIAFENWSSLTTTSSVGTPAWDGASTSRWPAFENGRLQTAARALGVMQAAYEAAYDYAAGPSGVRPSHPRLPAQRGRNWPA